MNEKELLTLNIGIIKSKQYKFADRGNIKTKCPSCHLPIEIILNGLPDDESLTPSISWKHEWWLARGDKNGKL